MPLISPALAALMISTTVRPGFSDSGVFHSSSNFWCTDSLFTSA